MVKKPKSKSGKKKIIIISIATALALLIQVKLHQLPQVVRMVDGDNFELSDGRRIRLINVDTPEEGQCFRNQSSQISKNLLLNKKVKIETDINNMDRFGRVLAYVFLIDGTFVNQKLLEDGIGEFKIDTINLKYQNVLIKSAEEGHDKIKGLWSVCAPDPQVGCLIKGNMDKRGHRHYVLPESRYWKQSTIRFDKADRWFCTEQQAINAGFLKARL